MTAWIQNVAVALIVLGALAWLVRRQIRAQRRASPACEDCPMAAPIPGARRIPPTVELITIGKPADSRQPR